MPPPAGGPPPFGTPAPTPQPSPAPTKIAGVSWKVWAGIAAVAVVAIVGAVVIGGGDDKKDTVAPSPTTVAVSSPNTTTAGDTTPETTASADTAPDETTAPDDTATETTFVFEEPLEGEIAGAPAGVTGTREQPVPPGEIANIGGGFRLQVLGIVPDATADVLAFAEFNEAPPAGSTYTTVKVALGYFGKEDPMSAFMPTLNAVGSANIELDDDCGLTPDGLDIFTEMFAGGVVVGNLCYVTTPADIAGLQLAAEGDFFQEQPVLLAAANPAAATPIAAMKGPQPGAASTEARQALTPIGTALDVGEGWSVTVNSAAVDITDAVVAESTFNKLPPTGYRYFGVDVTYAYSGAGSDTGFTVTTSAVADGNVRLSIDCGSIPNPLDEFADVFAGGEVTGQLCFVIPEGSTFLSLYSQGGFDGERVWFATA